MMVGRELKEKFPKIKVPVSDVVLEVRNLSVPGLLHDISFELRKRRSSWHSGACGSRTY